MDAFIKPTSIPSIFQNSGLNACGLHFNSEHYSSSLHSEFAIPLPVEFAGAVDERKAEFLASRHCARSALAPFGIDPEFSLASNSDRAPLWPEGIIGSITHSQSKCFVVTGKKTHVRAVGIDSENLIHRKTEIDRIESLVASPSERALIDSFSIKNDRTLMIGILFTVKESIYKAIHPMTGGNLNFSDVEVTELDLRKGKVSWKMTREIAPHFSLGTPGDAYFEWDGKWMHAIAVIPELKIT